VEAPLRIGDELLEEEARRLVLPAVVVALRQREEGLLVLRTLELLDRPRGLELAQCFLAPEGGDAPLQLVEATRDLLEAVAHLLDLPAQPLHVAQQLVGRRRDLRGRARGRLDEVAEGVLELLESLLERGGALVEPRPGLARGVVQR